MPKQIIILEKTNTQNYWEINAAFQVPVPTARRFYYANTGATSSYLKASAAELNSLKSGITEEFISRTSFSLGTPTGEIASALMVQWSGFSGQVANDPTLNFYGSNWDGSTWIISGS